MILMYCRGLIALTFYTVLEPSQSKEFKVLFDQLSKIYSASLLLIDKPSNDMFFLFENIDIGRIPSGASQLRTC